MSDEVFVQDCAVCEEPTPHRAHKRFGRWFVAAFVLSRCTDRILSFRSSLVLAVALIVALGLLWRWERRAPLRCERCQHRAAREAAARRPSLDGSTEICL